MTDADKNAATPVSRSRYLRERAARQEAEQLLEKKSRALYTANQQLSAHSSQLEDAVRDRTRALEHALEQAELAGKAKSRFVATMSHEIRTPLGGLLGMIDLLAMDETDPEKLELLNYAVTAGTGLNRIVNDVLDYSKMEAGVFVFEEERVDIRALIESVRMLAGSNEKNLDRTIRARVNANVPKIFLGDGTRMRQVISNFVTNALSYSTQGPVLVRASASPHKKGALLRVEVEDFGVGIEENSIQNLFKDFSQVANPLTAAAQGTGLGLAICKRILEGCGGTIGVESEIGEGSTFWFELPVTVIDQPDSSDAMPDGALSGQPQEVLDGKRVLIAEDNVINQRLLLTYAKRMNLVAQLAENGRIALEMFAPDKFDLVLMDVAMPEMDGLEATRQIRLKWKDADMPPILALTAHVMDAIEEEAAIVGIDTILSKPIPFEELKHALATALSEHQSTPAAIVTPDTVEADINQNSSVFSKMSQKAQSEMREMFTEDMLLDLIQKFVTDTTTRVQHIEAAIAQNDFKAASAEAHSIKGSSLILGFTDISDCARQIERDVADQHRATDIIADIKAQLADIAKHL